MFRPSEINLVALIHKLKLCKFDNMITKRLPALIKNPIGHMGIALPFAASLQAVHQSYTLKAFKNRFSKTKIVSKSKDIFPKKCKLIIVSS